LHIPTSMYIFAPSIIKMDTRAKILDTIARDVQKNGFQGLRADKVVATIGVTKGALYHYFTDKKTIGLSIIDEIIEPNYLHFYKELKKSKNHPIDDLVGHLDYLKDLATAENITWGCPLNNLVTEMSPLDEDFRLRLSGILNRMYESIEIALQQGKSKKQVKQDTDSQTVARFFMACIEGSYSMAKAAKSLSLFHGNMEHLKFYLQMLRA
jgi:TetR/AcrR family transcriptional regulator, transcriptional repressor for nem operon